jgi:hypothetical protein
MGLFVISLFCFISLCICFHSRTIREPQGGYLLTPGRIYQKRQNIKYWQSHEGRGNLITFSLLVQMYINIAIRENNRRVPWHAKNRSTIWSNNPKKWNAKEMPAFPCWLGLFTIGKIWNQPRCPSMNEWIKEMWHIWTVKYYSAIKKTEAM